MTERKQHPPPLAINSTEDESYSLGDTGSSLEEDGSGLKFDQSISDSPQARRTFNMIERKGKQMQLVKQHIEKIFNYIDQNDQLGLLDYVHKHTVQLHEIKDARGFTVMHFVAFKNNEDIAKILINLVRQPIRLCRRGTSAWLARVTTSAAKSFVSGSTSRPMRTVSLHCTSRPSAET